MPTLDELRRLLARGIGITNPPNVREGIEWDMSGEADHLDALTESDMPDLKGVDLSKMKRAPPKYTRDSSGSDAIIGFGKFKGRTLRDIYAEEPSYLGWLHREFSPLDDAVSKDFVDLVKLIIDSK